jgi:hypothetical protein
MQHPIFMFYVFLSKKNRQWFTLTIENLIFTVKCKTIVQNNGYLLSYALFVRLNLVKQFVSPFEWI